MCTIKHSTLFITFDDRIIATITVLNKIISYLQNFLARIELNTTQIRNLGSTTKLNNLISYLNILNSI